MDAPPKPCLAKGRVSRAARMSRAARGFSDFDKTARNVFGGGLNNSFARGESGTIGKACLPYAWPNYRLFWELIFATIAADTHAAGRVKRGLTGLRIDGFTSPKDADDRFVAPQD